MAPRAIARRPADGPDRVGQERARARARRALRRRDRQRRFGAGLSRHGHRHREARRGDARARAASPDRHRRSDRALFRRARSPPTRTAAIDAIRARGRVPILVGGTMLYFKALTRRAVARCRRPMPGVRAALDARSGARRLARAARGARARRSRRSRRALAPTDAQRIQRALEVHRADRHAAVRAAGTPRRRAALGPALSPSRWCPDRARLHAAIATRFDAMLAAGLVDEVRGAARATRSIRDCRRCARVGYRQAWEHLDGRDRSRTGCATRGIAATRQLAKRQLTWLRGDDGDRVRSAGARTRCCTRPRAIGRRCADADAKALGGLRERLEGRRGSCRRPWRHTSPTSAAAITPAGSSASSG